MFAMKRIGHMVVILVMSFFTAILITPGISRAELTADQLKAIKARRAQTKQRNINFRKERRKRFDQALKRWEQLRLDQTKRGTEANKRWRQMEQRRMERQKERLNRSQANRIDRNNRETERRSGNRKRFFRE